MVLEVLVLVLGYLECGCYAPTYNLVGGIFLSFEGDRGPTECGKPSLKRMRSNSIIGAKKGGSNIGHTCAGFAFEPEFRRITLTARRAASLADSIQAISV